jgi:hypothetical protein
MVVPNVATAAPYSGVVDELTIRRVPARTITLPEILLVSDGHHEVRVSASILANGGDRKVQLVAQFALDRWAAECRDGKCGVHRNA